MRNDYWTRINRDHVTKTSQWIATPRVKKKAYEHPGASWNTPFELEDEEFKRLYWVDKPFISLKKDEKFTTKIIIHLLVGDPISWVREKNSSEIYIHNLKYANDVWSWEIMEGIDDEGNNIEPCIYYDWSCLMFFEKNFIDWYYYGTDPYYTLEYGTSYDVVNTVIIPRAQMTGKIEISITKDQ